MIKDMYIVDIYDIKYSSSSYSFLYKEIREKKYGQINNNLDVCFDGHLHCDLCAIHT